MTHVYGFLKCIMLMKSRLSLHWRPIRYLPKSSKFTHNLGQNIISNTSLLQMLHLKLLFNQIVPRTS